MSLPLCRWACLCLLNICWAHFRPGCNQYAYIFIKRWSVEYLFQICFDPLPNSSFTLTHRSKFSGGAPERCTINKNLGNSYVHYNLKTTIVHHFIFAVLLLKSIIWRASYVNSYFHFLFTQTVLYFHQFLLPLSCFKWRNIPPIPD